MQRPHVQRLIGATLLGGAALGVSAQTAQECAVEPDPTQRLACYDRLFGAPPAGRGGAEPSVGPVPSAPLPQAVPREVEAAKPAEAAAQPLVPEKGSRVSRFWELEPADKRGTFIVRTYLPNYFLPLHYTSHVNRAPSTPTQPEADGSAYRQLGAKIQLSLRAKVASGVIWPDADVWFAYTQRSLWQLWNKPASSPFRSTDYQPEAIYVLPVPQGLRALPGGWEWRMVQLGIAHQSNGQSDPLSRSWNRAYLSTAFERGEVGLQFTLNRRFRERENDDNPDLTRYLGRGEIVASWLPGLATASLTWRTDYRKPTRGSLQLDWTYPVKRDLPSGLRWYVQLFHGYGETLLDYNHRQTTFGAGLTLFQF